MVGHRLRCGGLTGRQGGIRGRQGRNGSHKMGMSNYLYDQLIAPQVRNNSCFLMLDKTGTGCSELSFAEFTELASQFAHMLVAHGVRPGDRIAVQAPKRWEVLALYVASLQAGAVFLPLNTGYRHDEIRYFLEDATPTMFVCDEGAERELRPHLRGADAALLTLNADGSGSLTRAFADRPRWFDNVARGPDDLAALLYTSGTTGRSKGAMLTHNNLLSNARVLTEHWRISSDDTLIHALPIFHTHGLFVAMNTSLIAGVRVNFMAGFNLDAIIAALPESTLMMGVPTFYTRLLGDDRLDRSLVSNMRLFVSGSAPLPSETHAAFAERTGLSILERYGMTETSMITSNPHDGLRRAGTVGLPLDRVEVRITGTDGQPVFGDGVGVIEVRGPNVCRGYWNNPEGTAEALSDDGFFITGDLGRFDERGYLVIMGRQKDLIITGGYNVYPREVEDVLNSIAGVSESAVFGVPHADLGEQVIAAVVPETGATLNENSLVEEVETKLARFKHPRKYLLTEELPRNAMGKVEKNVLRDEYANSIDART